MDKQVIDHEILCCGMIVCL